MRRTIALTLAGLLLAALGAGIAWQRHNDPDSRRDRLLRSFTSVIPDTLEARKLDEIEGLVRMLWIRFDQGLVEPADVDEVETRMRRAIDNGYIGGRDLVMLMAKVGYYTYKGMPEYNLPGGVVDHPELNPSSSPAMRLSIDSATVADFLKWKEQMIREGRIDTVTGRYIPERFTR